MPVLVGKLDAELKAIVGKETRLLEQLNKYTIELGVIEGESKERKLVSFGLTNAELLFIHENGSPIKNIPARPVLSKVIEHVRDTMSEEFLNSCFDKIAKGTWSNSKLEKELDKFCIRIQNYAHKALRENALGLAPNKRHGVPLVDTGQLARSIVCRYVKSS